MNYQLEDFCHRVLGDALLDMATDTGTISQRLSKVFTPYFGKVHWRELEAIIPKHTQKAFLSLKQMLITDRIKQMETEREEVRKEYAALGVMPDEDRLETRVNVEGVIARYHWKKAQKIAKLMRTVYDDLQRECGSKATL